MSHDSTGRLVDPQGKPVHFFTGLGRNGIRVYRIVNSAGRVVDLTGKTMKVVVKSEEDAANTELDSNFPLSATLVDAPNGKLSVDFTAVNFTAPLSGVFMAFFDTAPTDPEVISQHTTAIVKAGV